MKIKVAALVALVLAVFLAAPDAQAQANAANYAYTTTVTGSLTNMSSGTTTLIAADQDDVASAVTPIGFEFFLMGVHQDRFSVNSNGTILWPRPASFWSPPTGPTSARTPSTARSTSRSPAARRTAC
jgi:hypothetical protein